MASRLFKDFLGKAVLRPIVPIMAMALVAGPVSAQDNQPAWLDVAIVQVKPGHAQDFEDLLNDFLAAGQAAGRPAGQVFEVVVGSPGQYHLVTPVASIAANETSPPPLGEAAMAVWFSRITQHIESARFFYARLHAEHTIQTDAGGSAELLILQSIRTVAGKQDEYAEWVADFLMPALRATDVAGHTLSSGLFGDSPQNFYHAIPVVGWSELDRPNPLQRSLGQRAYEQLMGRNEGLVESVSLVVARPRTDLMPGN